MNKPIISRKIAYKTQYKTTLGQTMITIQRNNVPYKITNVGKTMTHKPSPQTTFFSRLIQTIPNWVVKMALFYPHC